MFFFTPIQDFIAWTYASAHGSAFMGGDFSDIPLFAAVVILYRKHNCHVKKCWRIQWREHDGNLLCRRHHPLDDNLKPEDIRSIDEVANDPANT